MAASVVAGVGAVFVAVGGSQQVWKMLKRHRNDQNAVERMHDENKNALADMIEISQILSCIVEGVYKRCKDEKVPYTRSISEHWTHWGYEVVKFANLAGTYDVVDDDHWRAGDLGKSDDQCVRAVLFERSDSDQVPGNYINPPTSLIFSILCCAMVLGWPIVAYFAPLSSLIAPQAACRPTLALSRIKLSQRRPNSHPLPALSRSS